MVGTSQRDSLVPSYSAAITEQWAISIQQLQALETLGTDIVIQTLNDPSLGIEDRGQLFVCSEFDPPGICHTLADEGFVLDAPGEWTSSTPTKQVAEPSGVYLAAFGVLALLSLRRRAG